MYYMQKNGLLIFIIIILLFCDVYYTFINNKIVVHNGSKIRRYKPIKHSSHNFKKKISIVHVKSMNDLDWSYIKRHTNELQVPCIFELESPHKLNISFNDILKKQDIIQIQKIDTKKYAYINYSNYNPKKHVIFNQTILNKDLMKSNIKLPHTIYSNYFRANKGSVTGIHNEINSTLNLQISGKKKWVLVNPNYSKLLYPVKSTWRNYISKFSKRQIRENELLNIPHYECVVKPNQILFVPSWWWHHVITLEDNTESLSLRTVPPFTLFHKYFLPKSISSFITSIFISYLYKETDGINVQAKQLENIKATYNFI